MAVAPFNISTATPGDSDIVSQFPANERTNRDVINSWLLVEHDNTTGYHKKVTLPAGSPPATPPATYKSLYLNPDGNFAIIDSTGATFYLGVPPGTVNFTAGFSTPDAGWVFANGQAISRTGANAPLFNRIGIAYGAGDGSTTFNVPNINGRVIAGPDNGAGLLTSAGFGASAVAGAVGGSEIYKLLATDAPAGVTASGTNSISITPTRKIPSTAGNISGNQVSGGGLQGSPNTTAGGIGDWNDIGTMSTNNSISVVSVNASQTNTKNVQPTIILNAQIKL